VPFTGRETARLAGGKLTPKQLQNRSTTEKVSGCTSRLTKIAVALVSIQVRSLADILSFTHLENTTALFAQIRSGIFHAACPAWRGQSRNQQAVTVESV
jgi:hypothetical protein